MKKIVITIKGRNFDKLSEAARYCKIKPEIAQARVQNGWSIQEALGIKKRIGKNKEIKFKNYNFKSISEASRHFGIHPGTVTHRLKLGYKFDEVFGIKKKYKYIFKNKKFSNLKEAARYFKISYEVVNQRIRKLKWKPEEALEIKIRKEFRKGILGFIYLIKNKINKKKYVGATTQSPKERWNSHKVDAHKRNKIKGNRNIKQAILKYGPKSFKFSVLEKISSSMHDLQKRERYYIDKFNTIYPNGYNRNRGGSVYFTHGTRVKYNSKKYKSLNELCRSLNLDYARTHNRLLKGFSLEKAIREPIKFSKPIIKINGKNYYFIKDILKIKNIPIGTYEGRIQRGWNFKQAIGQEERIVKRKNFVRNIFFQYRDKKFRSIDSAAKYFNLKPNAVTKRIIRGWSKEKALGLKKNF